MLRTTRSAVSVRGCRSRDTGDCTASPRPRGSPPTSWRTTGHASNRSERVIAQLLPGRTAVTQPAAAESVGSLTVRPAKSLGETLDETEVHLVAEHGGGPMGQVGGPTARA